MATRTDLIHRGERVEYFTITWNSIEGLIPVGGEMAAGSVGQTVQRPTFMECRNDLVVKRAKDFPRDELGL